MTLHGRVKNSVVNEVPCRAEIEIVTQKIRKELIEEVKGWRMELRVA